MHPVTFRGVTGLVLVYDTVPIVDHFRALDENTIMGCMENKTDHLDHHSPMFFILKRADLKVLPGTGRYRV